MDVTAGCADPARRGSLVRRGWRRVSTHRGEAVIVGLFMIGVGVIADTTGFTTPLGHAVAGAGILGGALTAFAAVWLPIAVIDFRRCTRETALRFRVEADLARETAATRARVTEARAAEARCRAVLEQGGPHVVFQPIVGMADGRPVGYEALSRFGDERGPEQWFAEAASVGIGCEFELAAIQGAVTHLPQLPAGTYLSVNASPATLLDPRLAELLGSGSPDRIVIELTEHAPLDDYGRFAAALGELRQLGTRLAVDDAGAGYASFRHVVDLAPDIIKIDRSLVHGAHNEPARRSLMRAFVSFAADLGACLVAEGVECVEEETALITWGLRYAQGWLYRKPQPLRSLLTSEEPAPALWVPASYRTPETSAL